LRSGPPTAVRAQPADLFVLDRRRTAALPQLVERLRARLGTEAVHGLRLVPEHRPEAAQKNGDIPLFSKKRNVPVFSVATGKTSKKEECPHFSRPVWLLPEPQPFDDPLEIEDGPERIESGWWDGRDVRRDYYVARNPAGMRLWVFRERRAEGGWFLHGVFG
jgi:protein ImuB